jgi:hypothetical protein
MNSAEERRFKELLTRELERNELGGGSPYKLQFATKKSNSGWSFGKPQYDLGAGRERRLFEKILRNAKDGDKYIIDDGDPKTDREHDKKVADLCAKANKKGGDSLTTDERKLIDRALSSPYGKTAIDGALDKTLGDNITVAERVINLTTGADKEFLKTDLGKLFLCDFQNQYGIKRNGQFEQFVQGKTITMKGQLLVKNGSLGADELLKFYLNTKQAEQTPWDPLRRFSNIAEATNYRPSTLKEASGIIEAYQDFYEVNKERLTDTQSHLEPLNAFRKTVVDPAANEILAHWKPEWGNKPALTAYDEILAAVKDKDDMKFARQHDIPIKEPERPYAHTDIETANKEQSSGYQVVDPNAGDIEAGNWLRGKISDGWKRLLGGPSEAGANEQTEATKSHVQRESYNKEPVQTSGFDVKEWEKQFRETAPNATGEEFRRAKIFDAASTARIDHDIKDPELNAYAKESYYRRTAEDVQSGKGVPSVRIYDPQAEPTRVVRAFTPEEIQQDRSREHGMGPQMQMSV